MPPQHRKYLRYNADDFRVWAKSVGRKTENVIEYLLTSKREPKQAYKECSALSRLCDRVMAQNGLRMPAIGFLNEWIESRNVLAYVCNFLLASCKALSNTNLDSFLNLFIVSTIVLYSGV